MEFGEVVAMVVLFIGAPWAIFTGIAKVKASGRQATDEGSALRMSELRRLIDQAVDEATEPLIDRIETLEAIVTDEGSGASLEQSGERLDLFTLEAPYEPEPSVHRAVRS